MPIPNLFYGYQDTADVRLVSDGAHRAQRFGLLAQGVSHGNTLVADCGNSIPRLTA